MQKQQDKPRTKPKYKNRKPRSIYVPKKSTTASEGSVVGSEVKELAEESFDMDKQLASITESYRKLQTKYEEIDDEFKSSVFIKSKIEREKNQTEKAHQEKLEIYKKTLLKLNEKKHITEDLNEKILKYERENEQMEKENASLLQVILEKDKEIQIIQDTRMVFKTSNKGVNTVNGGLSAKLSADDQRMQEIYEEYEQQLKEAEQKLRGVENNLEAAKAKELELLARKAGIERELHEFNNLLKLCNDPANKTEERSINEIVEVLANLKKSKDNLEANLKETKTSTYIYKLITIFAVFLQSLNLGTRIGNSDNLCNGKERRKLRG